MKRKIQPDWTDEQASATADGDASPYDRPSKSQRKRDMLALQTLGEALAALPKEAFRKLPLADDLLDALSEARRITDHEGRRRQMQFVGKVMRRLTDEEVAALREKLDAIKGVSRAETVKLHAIERWRDQLIASDDALTDFIERYPHADIQQGRTLIRNARREAQQQRTPKYYRELFQWVKNAFAPVAAKTGDAPANAQAANADSAADREDDEGFEHDDRFEDDDD